MKALIVDCQRNGLAVVRSLGTRGIRCIAVDPSGDRPGLFSRYAARREVVPDVSTDESGFISRIAAIGREEFDGEKTFLVATNDIFVFSLARNWSALDPYFTAVFETNQQVLENCILKTRMYRVAEQAGIPHARSLYSPLDAGSLDDLRYPVIIKPHNRAIASRYGREVGRNHFCQSADEAVKATALLDGAGVPFVAQEFIPGGDDELYTAGIFALHGEVGACFTGRKLRQFPVSVGECSYGEAVRAPVVAEYAARFVRALGYSGIAQIEFKHCDGEYYLMEINPRSWSWHGLAATCGVDLPAIAVDSVNSGVLHHAEQSDFKARWAYLVPDMEHNVFRNKNVSFFRCLYQNLVAESHAFWKLTDPLPAVMHARMLARRNARRFIRALQDVVSRVSVSFVSNVPKSDSDKS